MAIDWQLRKHRREMRDYAARAAYAQKQADRSRTRADRIEWQKIAGEWRSAFHRLEARPTDDNPGAPSAAKGHPALEAHGVSSMPDRINRFRRAIVQILESARTCDSDLRNQYLALADEMQIAIEKMQHRQNSITDPAESPTPSAVREH